MHSCASKYDKLCQKIDTALEQNNLDETIVLADQVYDNLAECSCANAIDIAFAYFVTAHDLYENSNVELWLTKSLASVNHAAAIDTTGAEKYFESLFENQEGYTIEFFRQMLNTEIEYVRQGGMLSDDALAAQFDKN